MIASGQLQTTSQGNLKLIVYSLTDKGRRALHGDRELNPMTGKA
jgi:DNA-binding PadR family transcriptional regulator